MSKSTLPMRAINEMELAETASRTFFHLSVDLGSSTSKCYICTRQRCCFSTMLPSGASPAASRAKVWDSCSKLTTGLGLK
jgi:hypothetical protein